MQIDTLMHQNVKEQVNHLDAKYIKTDEGYFTIYAQRWLNEIQMEMSAVHENDQYIAKKKKKLLSIFVLFSSINILKLRYHKIT